MGLKSLVSELEKLFDTPKGRAEKQAVAIENLVEQLTEKKAKIKAKIAQTETEREKAKLERKLIVCKAQIKKGLAALENLRQTPND